MAIKREFTLSFEVTEDSTPEDWAKQLQAVALEMVTGKPSREARPYNYSVTYSGPLGELLEEDYKKD